MNNLPLAQSQYLGKPISLEQKTILAASAFLAGYSKQGTRDQYAGNLKDWFSFCTEHSIDPMQSERFHIELWLRSLETRPLKPRSVAIKLTVVRSFYSYCTDEGWCYKNPCTRVKGPHIERKSPRTALSRVQMADLLDEAQLLGGYPFSLVMILAFNGLRISEVCQANVQDIREIKFNSVLILPHRKGGKSGEAVLCAPLKEVLFRTLGDRVKGPLLLNSEGTRMRPSSARKILLRCAKNLRGDHPKVTPHVLRHSWATIAVKSGVNPRRIQKDAGWSDLRMLDYYDHSGGDPLGAATHSVAAHLLSL